MIMKTLTKTLLSLLLTISLSSSLFAAAKKLPTTDDSIYDQVIRKLANDPEVRGGNFKVTVTNGVVTIVGVVEKEKIKAKAEKLTKKINGVKQVDNQIRISPTRS